MAPSFLTSALDGGEFSALRLGRFTAVEIARSNLWIKGWADLGADVDAMEKRKMLPLPGIRPSPYHISVPTELSRHPGIVRMKTIFLSSSE
jgi:hypothetical protein